MHTAQERGKVRGERMEKVARWEKEKEEGEC